MTDDIDRGARALYEWTLTRPNCDTFPAWDNLRENVRELLREQFRFILTRIREPSESMVRMFEPDTLNKWTRIIDTMLTEHPTFAETLPK